MYIGIDTSNYTTSVAIYDDESIINKKKIISVPLGKKGMRQSECIFSHINALGDFFDELNNEVDFKDLEGVGVSVKPRNADASYMPVFLAGYNFARVVSASLGLPLYTYSHQEGHAMAALVSNKEFDALLKEPFIFLHLSGGTTEWVKCVFNGGGFDTEILASTADISAGQLIDRVGVKMGLPFPCGSYIENIAQNADYDYALPINVKKNTINFSGCEAELFRIMDTENYDCKNIAKSVLRAVCKTIISEFEFVFKEDYGIKNAVIAGGVASNEFVKRELYGALTSMGKRVFFANREYASDNAVGIAVLAAKENLKHGK